MAERIAQAAITVGGIGTIVAVSLICVFLIWVAVPLFRGAAVEPRAALAHQPGAAGVVAIGVDEYGLLLWAVFADGALETFRLDTGERLEARRPFGDEVPRCASVDAGGGSAAFGFADGSVRLAEIGFATRFLNDEPPELADLVAGESRVHEGGVVQRTPQGQLRLQTLRVAIDDPIDLGAAPIELIDHSVLPTGPVFCALAADDRVAVYGVRETENWLTDEVTVELREGTLPYEAPPGGERPWHLALSGAGSDVYLVWEDGGLVRYDARDFQNVVVAERLDLIDEPGERLTSLGFLTGKTTLVTGDSLGRVRGWFRIKPDGAETPDGALLVKAHEMTSWSGAAVSAIGASARSRTFAIGLEDGGVELLYMTSVQRLARAEARAGHPVRALALAPREDLLVAWTPTGPVAWDVDPRHPEASLGGLFGRTWYEGYESPEHVWQSSSGSDDFEPKLGLVPLIFGTLKATLYSMLFGAPLALLAAIYSSEFLDPRIRVGVKSTIEIMASLPSVVLGFLAALVIAPFVQGVLPAALAVFVTVPLAWLVGAYLWQLLPQQVVLRLGGWQRFAILCATLIPGVLLAFPAGRLLEDGFFAGDTQAWLDGQVGTGVGGWMVLFTPLSAVAVVLLFGKLFGSAVRELTSRSSRLGCATLDFARFVVLGLVTFCVALAFSKGLTAAGLDPRGSYLGTYVQRNALVVGFVMGFAVIPIIYTLAEDALSSVPEHLRLASLGAGATPWQTAVRVIIPTAMSGLFSALMIGLGRAVGETMIVLMATGNTPVMSWNVFSGFRTLSANIAVELPEAVRNSTHYRTLFLAALCLFAMTFLVNTLAEIVRQRFRKRAYQL